MKWIIISALRLSIYLGAIATVVIGALTGYVGGLNIENFSVTGIAGAIVGGVVGIIAAGLVFGTLTVLLDIRDSLAVIRDRTPVTPGEATFQEPSRGGGKRKEPFLGKT